MASVRCCAGTERGYVLRIIVVGKMSGLGCGQGWAAQLQSRWELEECGQNRLEGQQQQGSPRFRNSDGPTSAPATHPSPSLPEPVSTTAQPLGCGKGRPCEVERAGLAVHPQPL